MDSRGRLVPIPWLNFIRDDHVRSLFFFANGEPINDDGVIWLKQFVARLADGNRFSDEPKPSRLDLDGRVGWTERNLLKVIDIGAAVLYGDTPSLEDIDDRFQFAAACAELVGVIEAAGDRSDFITRLPIQFDASCSGLQNLCAMVRADEGKYVNLGPPPPDHCVYDVMPGTPLSDTHFVPGKLVYLGPEMSLDIYTLVQAEVHVDHPEFGDIVHPLERKLAKTPVMTKFYGCGLKKMAKQIDEALLGLDDPSAQSFRTDDKQEELAKAISAAIKRIAPKATELFEWLQELATICAKHEVLLRWTTPLGFIVINEYHPSITRTHLKIV
jgi:DNA-directed RNA polymerase